MIFKKQTKISHLLKLSGAGGYFQWNKPVHKEKKKTKKLCSHLWKPNRRSGWRRESG